MQQIATKQTVVQFIAMRTRRTMAAVLWLIVLLIAFGLVACGKSSSPTSITTSPAQLSVSAPSAASNLQNASVVLHPASGYGGLYIQVSGAGLPQNMMVLVTIEDVQGRSETLAASDTDAAGNLATGFLFPIDQRWFESDSLWVVATTADGRMETKARFEVVELGSEIASTTGSTSTLGAATQGAAAGDSDDKLSGDTTPMLNEQTAHTLVLPLIASTGAEQRSSGRAARNSVPRVTSSGATQVDIDIFPGDSKQIDCRNEQTWITVAIYSRDGFDATRIDPSSVAVTGGSVDLGYSGNSTVEVVVFKTGSKQEPAAATRQAYQWRWHLDDVDGDGNTDMVMEFRLDYTALDCNAAVAFVNGRTKDGTIFEGTNRVYMLVLERS